MLSGEGIDTVLNGTTEPPKIVGPGTTVNTSPPVSDGRTGNSSVVFLTCCRVHAFAAKILQSIAYSFLFTLSLCSVFCL